MSSGKPESLPSATLDVGAYENVVRLEAPFGVRPERRPVMASERDLRIASWLHALRQLGAARPARFREIARRVEIAARTPVESFGEAIARLRDSRAPERREADWLVAALALAASAFERADARPTSSLVAAAAALSEGHLVEASLAPDARAQAIALAATVGVMRGLPIHVVTIAGGPGIRRLGEALRPLESLGISLGLLAADADADLRRETYRADVVVAPLRELLFDSLRDAELLSGRHSRLRDRVARLHGEQPEPLLGRGLGLALLDPADAALLDEARVPFALGRATAPEQGDPALRVAIGVVRALRSERDYHVDRVARRISLSGAGERRVAELARPHGGDWLDRELRERRVIDVLHARDLLERDVHYRVEDEGIVVLDPYTGEAMPRAPFSEGIRLALEALEGCRPREAGTTETRGTVTRFLRRYLSVAGIAGSLHGARRELGRAHELGVVRLELDERASRFGATEPAGLAVDSATLVERVVTRVAEAAQEGRRPVVVTLAEARAEQLELGLRDAGHEVVCLAARDLDPEGVADRIPIVVGTPARDAGLESLLEAARVRWIVAELPEERRQRLAWRDAVSESTELFCLEDAVFDELPFVRDFAWGSTGLGDGRDVPAWLATVLTRVAQWRRGRRHARERRALVSSDQQIEDALAFSGRG